jgi:hypothetical protein
MHARLTLCRLAAVFALTAATAISLPTGAQTAETTPKATPAATATAPARKAVASKSANVKNGVISALDTTAETLTLRERTGKTEVYVLTAKTHFNRNRHPAQLSDFKIGDSSVLHFRKSRTDGALLVTELDDSTSWTWLGEMRKTTTAAVIKEITEDTLSVTVGAESVAMDYSISDKTRWEKAGKEVEAAAFKSGDRVFVVPRSLPSGGIMARAVADSTAGAAQEKERLATSVHGTITAVDSAAHKLTLATTAGDTRSLAYTDETEVVLAGKPLTLASLKTGQHAAARVRHEAGGDEVVWRITIETGRKSAVAKKRPTTGKGVVTGH